MIPLSDQDARKLKAKLEKPYWTRFWGRRCKVKPKLVTAVLGDGKTLISLTPLNTRPQHYFVFIDSSWFPTQDGEEIYDHLDEICDAIEDEFGCKYYDGNPKPNGWPALDLDAGCSWNDETKLCQSPSVIPTLAS
jgi:hypothetical protein